MKDKNKQEPISVIDARLVQLYKEKGELELDLERDLLEVADRISDIGEGAEELIREDQKFWFTEIYKYDFCIEELERIKKMI